MRKIKKIIVVFDDDQQFDVRDLGKEEYEHFLELMGQLKLLYTTIIQRQNSKDGDQ